MTSFFLMSRQVEPENQETPEIFEQARPHIKENIIPPIGTAKPELVESFQRNFENEEQILKDIAESEAYERETPFQTVKREALSHAQRGLEGFFGGVGSFLNMLTPELYENEEGMPYGSEEAPEAPEGFPSANKLREITKEKTGSYLEPKSEWTKTSQEVISDLGSMFSNPFMGFWTKLLAPITGQAAKQSIKAFGGSEKAQEYGKLGTMVLSSMANLGNAQKVASNAMRQAEGMIPNGLRFNARPTEQALYNIRQSNWFRTGNTPPKTAAINEIKRIEKQIQNGMIDGQVAMQLRKDINTARRQLGGFQLNQPVEKQQALHYLNEVDNALLQSMEHYGTRVNPQWWKAYNQANEAYRVTQNSRLISDFISQHAKPLQSETAKVLYHVAGGAAAAKLPVIGAAAIPVLSGAKTIQIMNRMIRSPVLRNHYIDVLKQASLGNAEMMNKALDRFDREAKKLESKNKSRLQQEQ